MLALLLLCICCVCRVRDCLDCCGVGNIFENIAVIVAVWVILYKHLCLCVHPLLAYLQFEMFIRYLFWHCIMSSIGIVWCVNVVT